MFLKVFHRCGRTLTTDSWQYFQVTFYFVRDTKRIMVDTKRIIDDGNRLTREPKTFIVEPKRVNLAVGKLLCRAELNFHKSEGNRILKNSLSYRCRHGSYLHEPLIASSGYIHNMGKKAKIIHFRFVICSR